MAFHFWKQRGANSEGVRVQFNTTDNVYDIEVFAEGTGQSYPLRINGLQFPDSIGAAGEALAVNSARSALEFLSFLTQSDGDARYTRGTGVSTIRVLTQAEFDAIATPDSNTLYLVSG